MRIIPGGPPPQRRKHKPVAVIVFSTKTADVAELPCNQCDVKVIIPAELLDVISPEDFICLPCAETLAKEEGTE